MKIAYVGNYNIDYTTENHIAKTLEKMGHEVIRIQETPGLNPGWAQRLVPRDTDLFLFTRTWGKMVRLDDLKYLKELGIPTASYHLDLYVGLSRQSGIENDPFWRTEYVFSADGDPESQKYFESKGINHFWLLPAVFEDECYIAEPNDDKTLSGDVVFIGSGAEYGHPEWPYRHKLVKFLEETYKQGYRKYGNPQRTVRGADLNQLYANAKIAVGDSVNIGFNHTNYTSDRLYESIGRGGFTIYPRISGVSDMFPESLQSLFYEFGDFAGLQSKIDYYLTHEEERRTLQLLAHQFVKSSQTYTQRLQTLLDTLRDKGAFDNQEDVKMPSLESSSLPMYEQSLIRINLGAGEDTDDKYINVDMIDLPGIDVVHNLINFPYPFEDNYAHEIKAIDVIEHLPNYVEIEKYDRNMYVKKNVPAVIAFIEECHRILRPGGTLYIQTPGWKAEFLWIDPTHVRGFDIQSMDFFDESKHFGKRTGFYSKCKFRVRAEELPNHNLRFWMDKI